MKTAEGRHTAIELPHQLHQHAAGAEEHEVRQACAVHPYDQVRVQVLADAAGEDFDCVLVLERGSGERERYRERERDSE
jgi:hypothetical protein